MPHAAIANAKGVPGTAGCVCWRRGEPHVLSTWHVLFGAGADEDGAVWLVEAGRMTRRIGVTKYGVIGTVPMGGEEYYLDCAVASCTADVILPQVAGPALATPGLRVTKVGGASAITRGIVADAAHEDLVCIEHRRYSAPRQILITPEDPDRPFALAGDSGAAVVDDENRIVGLLWGNNSRGQGLACHIAPVLQMLDVGIVAPLQAGRS
jgi:hypothetical protein